MDTYLKGQTGKCHISKGVLCLYKPLADMEQNFFKAFVQYNNMVKGAAFFANEECVKKVINSDYWFAKEKIDEGDDDKFGLYLFLGIAIGAVVVIGILLLVIYLKRGNDDEEERQT